MIKLYDYQERDKQNISKAFRANKSIVFQASTGFGKTIVMSSIIKDYIEKNNKNILVLVHRSELLTQTRETLVNIGVSSEPINDKTKYLVRNTKVYVAMVESLYNRLQKDANFLDNIGMVIVDECHIQVFKKVVDFFPKALELGFSATPVLNERIKFWRCTWCNIDYYSKTECCTKCSNDTIEFSRPFTMAELYDDIVIGEPIHKLIDRGTLCEEFPIVAQNNNLDNLKEGSSGDFTKQSLNDAFGSEDGLLNVLSNYNAYCRGKKTIIFNSSAKMNKVIYKQFKEDGINVRMFDSVNKEDSGKRTELLKWYENTPDAVLLNVGVFTTGFDEPTIEACILNTDTLSLSLYLQMVGRAGRSTNLIYKDKFILIDCGRNIERFGLWSDETRDWNKLFNKGIGKERPVRKMPEGFETCEECWTIFERGSSCCPSCGWEIPKPPPSQKGVIDSIAEPLRKVPPPNPISILKYTEMKNETTNFAFKILIRQICDMFVFYRVSAELYQTTKTNGRLIKRIRELIRPTYFTIIKSDLKGSNRKMQNIEDRILTTLDKRYEN